MYNPIATSRRQALSAAVVQFAIGLLVALGFMFQGTAEAIAAGVGGFAVALAHALAASISLGGVVTAPVALSRLLLGVGVKWMVVIGMVTVALGSWRLSPLPLLTGLIVGVLAYQLLVGLRFSSSARTQHEGRNA